MAKTTKKVQEGTTVSSAAQVLGAVNERKIIKAWQKKGGANLKRWWVEKPENLYKSIEGVVEAIDNAQSGRRLMNVKFARMYGNYESIGLPSVNALQSDGSGNRVTLNVIQSVIDACAAKIAKDRPRVSFVTTGAEDYFLKMRAAKLTKYVSGLFKQSKVYENSENVFRDASVLGTGYMKIYEEEGEIKTEWCALDEIKIDELDGRKQKPRSMHQVKLVPRDMLVFQYPDCQKEIESAEAALSGKVVYQSTIDVVRVVESWHLPSTKTSNDGIHCITIDNCTLFSEDYQKDYFPIVAFRWYNRPLGFFGRSITEEIMSIQIEINKILRTIQQSQELAAVPIIFVPNSAEIAEDVLLTNTIARMVPYSGAQPPQFFTPTAQNPEVYQHLNSMIQWAFQMVGLSQTSASGMKPAGVDSAVAIREVGDIETGRFVMVALRWEQLFVEIARIMVDMSKDMYTDNPELAVTVQEKKFLSEIRWKDVDLDDHPFDIQTFPTSQLPDTPAGRMQSIAEMIQQQWISKEKGMELLNLDPDLESEVNQQTSSLRLTEKWLSEMVEDGKVHHPDPFMNLQLAQQVSQGVLNQLQIDNCPDDRVQLVRDFIMEIIDMLQPPAQDEPPPPPEEMVQPGSQPMEPQQAEMSNIPTFG